MKRLTLENCADEAVGAAVVIDVLRAFTSSACAFSAGVREIILTASVEDALALREEMPGLLLAGEVDGLPIPGFDFGNSPSALVEQDLGGRRLALRTSAGTQGMALSHQADPLLAGSFVCAAATARYLASRNLEEVSFVITGMREDDSGDEDAACADYIAALLNGDTPDVGEYLARVRSSEHAQAFSDPTSPAFPPADLDIACDIDRFDFAMLVRRQDGRLILEKVLPQDFPAVGGGE